MSMISSADGAMTVDGTSTGLGGHVDRSVFLYLRSLADGVIVGARTVRREGYSPLPAHQRLAIVSTTGDFAGRTDALRAAGNTRVVSGDPSDFVPALEGNVWILEGGPTLNAQMLERGFVDEICLTISPRFIGSNARRIVDGSTSFDDAWSLAHIAHDDGFVFLRYLRQRRS